MVCACFHFPVCCLHRCLYPLWVVLGTSSTSPCGGHSHNALSSFCWSRSASFQHGWRVVQSVSAWHDRMSVILLPWLSHTVESRTYSCHQQTASFIRCWSELGRMSAILWQTWPLPPLLAWGGGPSPPPPPPWASNHCSICSHRFDHRNVPLAIRVEFPVRS